MGAKNTVGGVSPGFDLVASPPERWHGASDLVPAGWLDGQGDGLLRGRLESLEVTFLGYIPGLHSWLSPDVTVASYRYLDVNALAKIARKQADR